MNADPLPTESAPATTPARLFGRIGRLLVIAAVALAGSLVTATATAPPAAADVVICNFFNPCEEPAQIYPPPPLMYLTTSGYGGSAAQNASLNAFGDAAVQTVLDLHGLPASEEDAVRTWGRDEVIAQLYLQLVDAIQTPVAERTADQQNVADWAAEQARRRNAESATQAAREYVKWAGLNRLAFDTFMFGNPTETQIRDYLSGPVLNFDSTSGATEGWCVYRSPAPYGDEYQGFNNPVCLAPVIGFVLPPTPTYDQFVKWGAAKAHFQLLSNGDYTGQASRLGAALGVAVPLSVVVSSAATYVAAARIAAGTARLAQTSQLLARITGTTIQATSFSAAVASLIVASVSLALTVLAAIVTAILVGIDVTNAANLPGKLASLVASARSTVPDPTTLISSSDSVSSFASTFVAVTSPPPNLESCDNARAFPGFLKLTIIGTDQTSLSALYPCLNPTTIPAVTGTEPMWSLTEQATGAETNVATASFQTPSGATAVRFNRSWFVTTNNGTTSQTLRLAYTDWAGKTQNAWVIADAAGYSFLTYQPPTDSSSSVDINTCIDAGTCGVSQSIQFTGSDGKKYTGSIRAYQPPTGTPTVTNLVQGSPTTFNANGFAPGGATAPVTYTWTVTPNTCFLFVCPTLATLTGATPTFTFDRGGTYNVAVTATDATSLTTSTSVRFDVTNAPPTFTLLPTCTGAAGPSCNTFTSSPGLGTSVGGTIGYPGNSDVIGVQVDWGDGNSDSVQGDPSGFRFPSGSPVVFTPVAGQRAYTLAAGHTYAEPGTYQGSIRVVNFFGLTGDGPSVTLPFTITVVGSQVITFTPPSGSSYGNAFGISATGGASGQPVTFAASGACTLSDTAGGAGTGAATVTITSAGTCTLTASQAGGSGFQPAPDVVRRIFTLLAPLKVTASSPTIVYGEAIPTITPSYDGFKLTDSPSVLLTPPTCSVTAPAGGVGTAPTNCSGAVAENYSLNYVPGTLTIERAPLTVTADDATMVFGRTVPAFTPSYTGFVGNDGPSVVSGVTCGARDAQDQPVSSTTPAGSYTITCSGGISPNYTLEYRSGTLRIDTAATTTTLGVSPTTAVFGQPLTLTATVAVSGSGTGTPGGTVAFRDGSTVISGCGAQAVDPATGRATCTTSALAVGARSLAAAYGGDANFDASETPTPTALTIAKAASVLTLSVSANPITVGQVPTLTAVVAAVAPGAGNPTGTVTFSRGTTVLGTGTLSTSNGVTSATFSPRGLRVGRYTLAATYGGDGNVNAAARTALVLYVNNSLTGFPRLATGGLDLNRANLKEAYLVEAALAGARIRKANLEEAVLLRANLSGSTITDSNLEEADLEGANLSGSTITDSSFKEADLEGANLSGTALRDVNLKEADLAGANLSGATLTRVNLRDARGLRSANLTNVVWRNVTCPSGTNSDRNGGTCLGQL